MSLQSHVMHGNPKRHFCDPAVSASLDEVKTILVHTRQRCTHGTVSSHSIVFPIYTHNYVHKWQTKYTLWCREFCSVCQRDVCMFKYQSLTSLKKDQTLLQTTIAVKVKRLKQWLELGAVFTFLNKIKDTAELTTTKTVV